MLVFYTWSIRLLAETVGLFGSAEKLSWLANHTPQEGGRLAPPALVGAKGGESGAPKRSGCCGGPQDPSDSTGVSLPSAEVCWAGAVAGGSAVHVQLQLACLPPCRLGLHPFRSPGPPARMLLPFCLPLNPRPHRPAPTGVRGERGV